MIINKHDLENDRTADEQADYDERLEEAQQALCDDLYDAYFGGNESVVEEVNDKLAEQGDWLFEWLRSGFDTSGSELRDAYSKAVTLACNIIACSTDGFNQIERIRREWNV